jgi:hypothetical protein
VVNVHAPDVDVSRVPPPGGAARFGAVADETHEGSGDEKRQDEGEQTAQQWQVAAVEDVMCEPVGHRGRERVEHS